MKDYYLLEIDDAVAALRGKDEQIEELRSLLRECKKYIDFCCVPDGFGKSYIAEDLLTRINAAIGESEE